MTSNEQKGKIKRVILGDNGPEVSELCLGTMTWGSQTVDEKKIAEMLNRYVVWLYTVLALFHQNIMTTC